MSRLFLLAFLFLSPVCLFAQDTITFDRGLAVPSGSRYGREAIYTDLLAYKLSRGEAIEPANGKVFSTSARGDKLLWHEVVADSTGRFRIFSRRNFQPVNNPFLNPGSVDRGADYLYLSYRSDKQQAAILNIEGNSGVYFNGVPHMGDPYRAGYMHLPVMLRKGLNEIYIRGANVQARIILPQKLISINTDDLTLPNIVMRQQQQSLQAALTVINTSAQATTQLLLRAILNGKMKTVTIPAIPAMAMRKVIFEFDAANVTQKGKYDCQLVLFQKGKIYDEKTIKIEAVDETMHHSNTFISAIDGSLQYYAVTPQLNGIKDNAAMFLSVHGAGVEAIGQAKAYRPKEWGTVIAPTNRRPRGFNWEDWGRQDALEVLNIARQKYKPNPLQIYLTGHSMGGHGTWFLGATYPDKWAAIGPAAGYASLKDYGSADGRIPDSSSSAAEKLLLRAGNQSDVPKLAFNYRELGVYVLHGDSDRVVPVTYARQMREVLGGFHKDFSYYEYPGGEHWFGDQSVDWPPMFNYFKWHSIQPDSAVNNIDFTTSSPGISASYRWATVYQQLHPLKYSRIILKRNKHQVTGTTENVAVLRLALNNFPSNAEINIELDKMNVLRYRTKSTNDTVFFKRDNKGWNLSSRPDAFEKGPERYGTFKEAFNNHMVFVVGTMGKADENEVNYNKALYDAESWYYRGNGAVDIVTDKEFLKGKFKGRNVIIYGNSDNNAAWKRLLKDCPIQVENNQITAGSLKWTGEDLASYFVWPQKDSKLLVGVVTATGVTGMKAAYANQYFAGGSGFPDFMIFNADMLKDGSKGVKLAGFFNNRWQLDEREYRAE